jgi:hypothetical protein
MMLEIQVLAWAYVYILSAHVFDNTLVDKVMLH